MDGRARSCTQSRGTVEETLAITILGRSIGESYTDLGNGGIDEGWNTYLVDRYVGHAPQTVAERHYFGDKKGRMVEVFREHVAAKIDGLIDRIEKAKWHKMAQATSVVPFLKGVDRR
jgi:hypothetical protein